MVPVFRTLGCATALFLVSLSFTRCQSSKKELLQSVTPTCDTTNVTYLATIQPILSANCYECHGSAVYQTQGNGNSLEDYSHVLNYAQPGGLLVNDISHTPGHNFMPKDRAKLSDCDIAKIKKWVNAGAPNN